MTNDTATVRDERRVIIFGRKRETTDWVAVFWVVALVVAACLLYSLIT
jgi:hypothetical protein